LLIDVRSDEGIQSANIDTQPDEAVTEASLNDRLYAHEDNVHAEAGKHHTMVSTSISFFEDKPTAVIAHLPMIKIEPASGGTSSSPSMTPRRPTSVPVTPRKRTGLSSPFFTTPSSSKKNRPSPGTVSSIEAPPLSHTVFGLIQEELADDPFKLLVAVIYLNRTRATIAIPKFRRLIECNPTAEDVARANVNDIADFIQPLGLHNQRAATIVNLANVWISNPPVLGWRFRTPGYPTAEASKDIKADEVLSDADPREGAFEIGHISGLGVYAYDSWRIFCRDKLRGLAESWNGQATTSSQFEPEWKRVLPKDKELRAFLRWMWLKEGWRWDPLTGEKEVASEDLMRRAHEGGVKWDEDDL
jgi:hypothetical protein